MSFIQVIFDEMICKSGESSQEVAIQDFKDKVKNVYNTVFIHFSNRI